MEKVTFPNGLRVLMEKQDHVRSVSFGFWIKSGSAYETAAGLPDNERITRTDGTWRPGVTEQQAASLYRQAQALLAP